MSGHVAVVMPPLQCLVLDPQGGIKLLSFLGVAMAKIIKNLLYCYNIIDSLRVKSDL